MNPIASLAALDSLIAEAEALQRRGRCDLDLSVQLQDLCEIMAEARPEVHEAACEQAAAERQVEEQKRAAQVQAEFREIEMAARGPLFMRRYFSPRLKAMIIRRCGARRYNAIPW